MCWFCYWGIPSQINEIYERAKKDIDKCLDEFITEANNWGVPDYPTCGESALNFGPAHVVWDDYNFELAKSCLNDCDSPMFKDWYPPAMEIIKRSLRELDALPLELKIPPEGMGEDADDHPERYPPNPNILYIKR